MAAIELIDVGAGLMVVVGTVLVVSARLALPAAALGTHWRDAPPRWRAMAAAFIVEPLYVVVAKRYEDEGTAAEKRKFYEGAAAVLWLGWVTSTAVGILVGGHVPKAFALDAMMPLSLIGLLLPMLRDRRSVVAAAVGMVAACVLAAAPNGSGVVLASVLGVVGASVWRDRR
jgi:predicted branched-subunit amino acid permease